MPTAYAYIRYSSKAQGEAGRDSVDRQMASIQAIVKTRNLHLPPENIFSDTGISAFTGSNKTKGKLKDLIDMISDLRVKSGDYIFVESIDRLSRQRLLQAKELVNGILEKGIVLITTIDGQRYEKPNDHNGIDDLQQDILLSVIAKRAYEESKTKSVRRKSAWNRAKKLAEEEQQIFNGHNPPYGIRYDKENNCFEIVEEEANEIRDIFESLKYVGVSLSIKKVNAYAKRRWTNRNIKMMLDTKYVLGSYMAQRRDENRKKVFERYIEGYYPQIVSHELFNEAVSAMKSRAHRKHYGNQTVGSLNIFRHSVKCSNCNASMLFEKQKNPKGVIYPYFQCFTRKELKSGCDQPRFRFDLAFGVFLELVHFATTSSGTINHSDWEKEAESVGSFQKTLFKLLTSTVKDKALEQKISQVKNLLLEQKNYQDNINKSFEAFKDGIIPSAFIKKASETESKIESLEKELAELNAEHSTRSISLNVHSYNDIIDLYRTETGRQKINKFFISNNITFNFSFEQKARMLRCKIYYKGIHVDVVNKKFPLHNPLKEFGIDNLNEYFN